jgi:hypothetical protein
MKLQCLAPISFAKESDPLNVQQKRNFFYTEKRGLESPLQTQGKRPFDETITDARRKMSRTGASAQTFSASSQAPCFKVELFITTDTGEEQSPAWKESTGHHTAV